ncbi:EVE domain-containing protein [Intestinirhabdus alba]|jgi:hypothetical protein|uniref:EVE domain-containing protein n=1 Tax=Intestinirhabdus alba TaxID=2899544 RepID=A0A6L6ITT4_9ENTR|nr:EVE domain-containing protein [Intestinirhabdus alba]MTH48796.1 EVE domain-containing protein [Intestinirhabdus alba]
MKHWLAVASAAHVALGYAGNFMQVCHGKKGPLSKINPADGIVYYSPSKVFGKKDGLMSLTAIGYVAQGEPYPFDMGGGFVPFRRDVVWLSDRVCPIAPLLDRLEFTANKKSWG